MSKIPLLLTCPLLALLSCTQKDGKDQPASAKPVQAPPPGAASTGPPREISISSTIPGAVDAFRRGRELWENARTAEAAEQFRKALQLDPSFALAHGYLALSTSETEGMEHADKAAALSAGLPVAERLQTEMLVAQKRGEEAKVRDLRQKLTEAVPNNWRALLWLSFQAFNEQKWEEATSALRRAIDIDPTNGQLYNELGYSLAFQGKYEDALAAMDRYVQLKPDDPNPHDSRAEIQMMAGRLKEAEAGFRKAAATAGFWSGLEGVAYVRFFGGDWLGGREAIEQAREGAKQPADRLELGQLLVLGRLAEGDPAAALRAIDDLEREVKGNPVEEAQAPLLRALVLSESGRQPEALRQVAQALSLSDQPVLAGADRNRIRRGALSRPIWSEASQGKVADAERTLLALNEEVQRALENVRLQSRLRFGHGAVVWAKGDIKAAETHLAGCLEDDYFCRWLLFTAQERLGMVAEARTTREQILGANRRDPLYLYVRTRLGRGLGPAGAAGEAPRPK